MPQIINMARQPHLVRIAICHRAFVMSDAIGHDILGMYSLLSEMGFDVAVLGEFFDRSAGADVKFIPVSATEATLFDLIIYHHSINWAVGEKFLRNVRGTVVFRYHSITPPAFLQPYSTAYANECAVGIQQTVRLLQHHRNWAHWMATSHFSRNELLTCGADPSRVSVVPPFTLVADYFALGNLQDVREVKALFIGRFVPNKAHRDLIKIVHSYLHHIDDGIILELVGTLDDNFRAYFDELQGLVDGLGIRDHVQMKIAVSHDDLAELLRSSTVFLCCSVHEGFCVPVIEAQAAGVPVISVNAGALSETLGPGQVVCDLPETSSDYLFYAYVIREVVRNLELRRMLIANAHSNVIRRFSPEAVENQFLASLLPALTLQ